jgi:hypothetical protein
MTKPPILCDLITNVYLPFLGIIYLPGKHVFQYIASFHYSPPECQSLSSGGCLTPSQLFYGSILLLVYQRQPAQAPCGCPRKLMACDQNPPTRKVTSGAGNTAPQLKRLLDLNVTYQTVRNALRKASLKCTGKQRKHFLSGAHWQCHSGAPDLGSGGMELDGLVRLDQDY